jgi:hypothetical protein
MKKHLLIICISFIFLISGESSFAQPGWLWANGIVAGLNDKCNSLTTDATGNSYATGSFQGTVDFDPTVSGTHSISSLGALDSYILKLNAAGDFVWAIQIGSTGTDEGFSVTTDKAGNIYATGTFQDQIDFDPGVGTVTLTPYGNYDVYIAKYDASANLIWVRQLGGTSLDSPNGITTDDSANVYTAGYFSGTADFDPEGGVANLTSAGSADIFVSKLDSSGHYVWARNMGGSSVDHGQAVAVDGVGNVYVTGTFTQTADLDPGVGVDNATSGGSTDAFIVKLDNAGDYEWGGGIGKTGADNGNSLIVDGASNVYLTGKFTGTVNFDIKGGSNTVAAGGASAAYVSKYDSSGNIIRVKALTTVGNGTGEGMGLAVDPVNADLILAGGFTLDINCDPSVSNFTLASQGIDDILVARYDSAGTFVYAKSAGGSNSDYVGAISISGGYVYMGGTFHSPTIAFDAITVTNAVTTGFPDIYVSKLDNLGTGVKAISNNRNIKIYPSPANDFVRVMLPPASGNVKLNVTDIGGRAVKEMVMVDNTYTEIETTDLPVGVYLLNVTGDNFTSSAKFTILR